jgi:hypothetical protein
MGEYRLFRQSGGHTGFAHVRVEVVEGTGRDTVEWAVDPADPGSAQPDRHAAEVDAALAGAADGLAALAALGIDTAGRTVRVTWLGVNLVDTEPTAVRAAACAATADAFGAVDRFEIVFDDGWRCRPTA